MFKLSDIKELVKLVDSTSIQHLEIEQENMKISIRKPDAAPVVQQVTAALPNSALPAAEPQPVAAVQAAAPAAQEPQQIAADAEADASLHRIVSPMVGTFYAAPSPDSPPFVKVGDTVNEKTVVCIVEAMKLMNEIEAEVNGKIVEVLVQNGQLVEFGQPLFLVKR